MLIKLDPRKLLGFRALKSDMLGVKAGAKPGTKLGFKAGTKVGAKTGVKK
jgi:hypothetical protein